MKIIHLLHERLTITQMQQELRKFSRVLIKLDKIAEWHKHEMLRAFEKNDAHAAQEQRNLYNKANRRYTAIEKQFDRKGDILREHQKNTTFKAFTLTSERKHIYKQAAQ